MSLFKIIQAMGIFAFIIGGVSLGPKAVHPAWAYVAIYVILYAGFMAPRIIKDTGESLSRAILLAYFVGLPLMAAQWLLTH